MFIVLPLLLHPAPRLLNLFRARLALKEVFFVDVPLAMWSTWRTLISSLPIPIPETEQEGSFSSPAVILMLVRI
jgi:hypothetical protein